MANPINAPFNTQQGSVFLTPGAVSPDDQMALIAYAFMLQLKAIGGIDYTNNVQQLVTDANKNTIGMGESDMIAQFIAQEFSQATSNGATVPATTAGKLAPVTCLLSTDRRTRLAVLLQLNYLLGINKNYPQ